MRGKKPKEREKYVIRLDNGTLVEVNREIYLEWYRSKRKPLDIRFTDYPYAVEKGLLHLFLLPARTGPGRARQWVKGLVPCRFLGQRPKFQRVLNIVCGA